MKTIIRMAASTCCACLVALTGFGVWRSGMLTALPEQTEADALNPGVKETSIESKGESPGNLAANNKIIVHQIDWSPSDEIKFDVQEDDFVVMSKAEINKYYRINIFPTVPDDLKEWEDEEFGVYKRNGGTGEIYFDFNILNYSNETFSKGINIEIQKGSLPTSDCVFLDEYDEKSIINNVEVAIGQDTNNEYYFAEFLLHNVGFRFIVEGLTQDEFVAVISSLIQ